uniref:Uncharacterized protein n=1 Tax=Glossina brevipalpis TaxID=37001 RepID=A0A1A9W4I4_9MUSC
MTASHSNSKKSCQGCELPSDDIPDSTSNSRGHNNNTPSATNNNPSAVTPNSTLESTNLLGSTSVSASNMASADSSVASTGSLDDEESVVSTSTKISQFNSYDTPSTTVSYRRDSDTSSQHSLTATNTGSGAVGKRRYHQQSNAVTTAGIIETRTAYYSTYYNKQQLQQQQQQQLQSPQQLHTQLQQQQQQHGQDYYGKYDVEFAAANSPQPHHRLQPQQQQQQQNTGISTITTNGEYLSPKPDFMIMPQGSPHLKVNELTNVGKLTHGPTTTFHHPQPPPPPPPSSTSQTPAQHGLQQAFYNQHNVESALQYQGHGYNHHSHAQVNYSHHHSSQQQQSQQQIHNDFDISGNYYETKNQTSSGGYNAGYEHMNFQQPSNDFQQHIHHIGSAAASALGIQMEPNAPPPPLPPPAASQLNQMQQTFYNNHHHGIEHQYSAHPYNQSGHQANYNHHQHNQHHHNQQAMNDGLMDEHTPAPHIQMAANGTTSNTANNFANNASSVSTAPPNANFPATAANLIENSNSSSDFNFLSNLANDFVPEYYQLTFLREHYRLSSWEMSSRLIDYNAGS